MNYPSDKETGLEFSKPRVGICGRKKKILRKWSQEVSTFQLFNISADFCTPAF
jgi:hypothetical protein